MDHQWNYATGLPDPAYPGMNRGLNANNSASIWVNTQGERFVNEVSSTKERFKVLLEQKPSRYWAIFDEKGKLIRTSQPITGGLKFRKSVPWPEGFRLDAHVSKTVSVRFELTGGAKLFAIRFDEVFWE